MLSNRLKKLQNIGFISKQKGTINKKSIYYLLEKKGIDTFPILIEMSLFSTKHYFDHLGLSRTKDARTKIAIDKIGYTKELMLNYKRFVKTLSI
jgi:DNA-binding HxlR family transcriptional regulator